MSRTSPWTTGLCASLRAGLLTCVAASGARAALVLNEVLYDPSGPDGGAEWVEILNTGPWPVGLDGIALDSGDGAAPNRFSEVWRADPTWVLPSGGFLWIGGPHEGRVPDGIADLGLQNGPDAVRLRKGEWVLDLLGWGEHEHGEYFEGSPAPGTRSGESLSRRSDGEDTDDNARDWVALVPSPGRPNRSRVDIALTRAAGRLLPRSRGASIGPLDLVLANRGREPAALESILVTIGDSTGRAGAGLLAPGALCTLRASARAPDRVGRWDVALSVSAPRDQIPENDGDTVAVWVGPPAFRLTELCARPDSSGTEWVELAASGLLELAGCRLEDAGGTALEFTASAWLHPGEVGLVSRDASRAPIPGLAWSGTWPSLNDAQGPDGVADSLFLTDPNGCVVDWAVFGRSPVRGTWQRVLGPEVCVGFDSWRLSPEEPSPGEANGVSALAPEAHGDDAPRFLSLQRHSAGAWLRIVPPASSTRYRARILDLSGRVVWTAAGEFRDNSERWLLWDGEDSSNVPCANGLYVVSCETDGVRPVRDEVTLVLGR